MTTSRDGADPGAAAGRTPFEVIAACRLVPVVEIPDDAAAGPLLAEALLAAGLGVAEITFRTAGAVAAIAAIRRSHPAMLVGAGTVLTPDQVRIAADAGAAFLVSPGFGPRVVEEALRLGVPIIPGATSPSEVQVALEAGLSTLKFFPAGISGAIPWLQALAAPFAGVRFVPTGGVNAENLASYLALPNVMACGGSWFVRRDWLAAGDYEAVRRAATEAVEIARSVR